MKDGDIVYSIGGSVKVRQWIVGSVVEFSDTTIVLYRDVEGKIVVSENINEWSLTKKEAKLKVQRGMIKAHADRLKTLEALDDNQREPEQGAGEQS